MDLHEIEEIEGETYEEHFSLRPKISGDYGLSRFENSLDNSVRSLTGRSFSCDPFVFSYIPDTKRIIPHTAVHGCVEYERFNTEISRISVLLSQISTFADDLTEFLEENAG